MLAAEKDNQMDQIKPIEGRGGIPKRDGEGRRYQLGDIQFKQQPQTSKITFP